MYAIHYYYTTILYNDNRTHTRYNGGRNPWAARADGAVTHAGLFDRTAAHCAVPAPQCRRLRRPNVRRLRRRPPCSKPCCPAGELSRKLVQWQLLGRWMRRTPSSTASPQLPIPRRVHATPRPLLRTPPLWHAAVGAVAVSDSESGSGSAAAPPPPPPPPRTSSRGALPPSQSSVAPPQPRPAPQPAAPWPTLSILSDRGWVGGVGGWSLPRRRHRALLPLLPLPSPLLSSLPSPPPPSSLLCRPCCPCRRARRMLGIALDACGCMLG